ncbi:29532_t:CDS:2 [Gigaspora margarita]|uniref:29532_t:CDS:1 n=1 Tax=Gigaspora margarita TaxID=4874 RepID=A0ABN7UEF6_GIGMA|nr:29532_t:CDS:2 [Gigaspora margarita]
MFDLQIGCGIQYRSGSDRKRRNVRLETRRKSHQKELSTGLHKSEKEKITQGKEEIIGVSTILEPKNLFVTPIKDFLEEILAKVEDKNTIFKSYQTDKMDSFEDLEKDKKEEALNLDIDLTEPAITEVLDAYYNHDKTVVETFNDAKKVQKNKFEVLLKEITTKWNIKVKKDENKRVKIGRALADLPEAYNSKSYKEYRRPTIGMNNKKEEDKHYIDDDCKIEKDNSVDSNKIIVKEKDKKDLPYISENKLPILRIAKAGKKT